MSESQHTLPLERVRQIFATHRGEAKAMAEKLGKSETTISWVLRGKTTSRAVLAALQARAQEILQAEEQAGRAA